MTEPLAPMMNPGMYSSLSHEWETPSALYDSLHREFDFTLDAAASHENAKCAKYFTIDDDGLSQPWDGRVWVNPPYGRGIGHWVEKAYQESRRGSLVVCLIPSRTDTGYWHDYAMKAAAIRFIRGRLHFSSDDHAERKSAGTSAAHNAPFPSAVVIFSPGIDGPPQISTMNRGV